MNLFGIGPNETLQRTRISRATELHRGNRQTVKPARYIFFTNDVEGMVSFYRNVMKMKVVNPPKAMDYDAEDWVQVSSGGVEIGANCLVASGSEVPENTIVPDLSLVVGAPGRIKGSVPERHTKTIAGLCDSYIEKAQRYKRSGNLESD